MPPAPLTEDALLGALTTFAETIGALAEALPKDKREQLRDRLEVLGQGPQESPFEEARAGWARAIAEHIR